MKPSYFLFIFCIFTNICKSDTDIIFMNGFEIQECNPSLECCQGNVLFQEDFNVANQNWQGYNQWQTVGSEVALAQINNNQARLIPVASNYSLARITNQINAQDMEVTFSLTFENALTQGVGFYVRGNGGYLQQTNPTGQGYAVFIEKFDPQGAGIGLWYENNGQEISFVRDYNPSYQINDETEYQVRFQVFQESATTTRLRARFWQAGSPEPNAWQVNVLDNFAPLQNTSGDIAVDSWSTQQNGTISAAIRVDNIQVTQLCNPLLNFTSVNTIESGLQFAEGPVWQNNSLFFSDINANTIYQWQQGIGLTTFSANSNNANGLAYDSQGYLYAAEHGSRRVSVTNTNGATTLLVDGYMGNQFNSPNDVVVSDTGVTYFTDPDYGLAGRIRELNFHGVFRYHTQLGIFAEYQGNISTSRPNGIALSPNQDRLYWSDTQSGFIYQMLIGSNGALSDMTVFAENLTVPDGMCVDESGNVFIATWNSAVEVFSANGDYWGSINMPENSITNCTFGEDNNETLFITGQNNLYRSQAPL